MKHEIQKYLKRAIEKAKETQKWPDFEAPEIIVDYAKDEKFGDYATNIAMVLSKQLRKNPLEIAEALKKELSSCIQELSSFERIETVAPGYINFYLSQKYFQTLVEKISEEKNSFANLPAKKEKVMVEYSQPNTHKEFHIGHLRNVFIGNALVNVLKKGGYDVTSANYIGDTGTHIAKCLWGITKFHGDENLDIVPNKAEFLGKVYTEAVRAITDKPEYEEEFKNLQKQFEAGDEKLVALWKKTKQWSLDEFDKIYTELGVNFDTYFWESEEEKEGKEMLPQILKTKNIKESEGAIVADLEEFGLGVLVLVRKDGSALYGLKDIPLAIRKFKEYDVDKSVVVVDLRQSLYFKQIFKILQLMGFEKDMAHVGYEFVSLKGNELMSSRKGNIVPAQSLIDEMVGKVKNKFPETEIAEEIAMGALKFHMLKYSAPSKIEFDVDESIKLEGATGPYVQYAHARICSILEKAKGAMGEKGEVGGADLSLLTHEKELGLIKELNKFPELIEEISQSYAVHKLPHYAIRLADKFHSFYDACRVIDQENPGLTSARLSLVNAVRIVLAEALDLIGVSAPKKM